MNYVYTPKNQAQIADLQLLRDSGRRSPGDLREAGPADRRRANWSSRPRSTRRTAARAGARPAEELRDGREDRALITGGRSPDARDGGPKSDRSDARPGPSGASPICCYCPACSGWSSSSSSRWGSCRDLAVEEGSLDRAYELTWHWANFSDALSTYDTQFFRSFLYAGIAATALPADRLSARLRDRVQGGQVDERVCCFAVVAPFFTTYLIRTLRLADDPLRRRRRRRRAEDHGRRSPTTARPADARRIGDRRPDLQLPAVHDPADLRPPRADGQAADRGRAGTSTPRRARRSCKVTLPISMPGVIAGTLLTFIPAVGDYINATSSAAANQAMIGNVIQGEYLVTKDYPIGGGALVHADGADRRAGPGLHQVRRAPRR